MGQTGSAPTGSTCKAAILRVKCVGKKWDDDNAEAVMTLEALDPSGARDKFCGLPPHLALWTVPNHLSDPPVTPLISS